MKKQPVDIVKSYVRKLPDEDFTFLYSRLKERYIGDVAEAIRFMEKSTEMDRLFSTSKSADELYDMVDLTFRTMESDAKMRSN